MPSDKTFPTLSVVAVILAVITQLHGTRQRFSDDKVAILTQRLLEELLELENAVPADKSQHCGNFSSEAVQWIKELDPELADWSAKASYASWDYETNLTEENQKKLEAISAAMDLWIIPKIDKAKSYLKRRAEICDETAVRLLDLLVNGHSIPIAKKEETRASIESLVNSMSQIYGTATVTKDGKTYRLDPDLTDIMAESRDPNELKWAWLAWRNVTGPLMKPKYAQLVAAMNEAARDNDFSDVSQSWNMADFGMLDTDSMVDDLYSQILPLYKQLHAYVRSRLAKVYPDLIDKDEPIPAHLLGNMWSQIWLNIQDLVIPFPNTPDVDITAAMVRLGYTPKKMFDVANDFFTSLGLEPMTQDFWKYSVITRPKGDIEMVCHASASEFYSDTDFRIKMCTSVNENDFQTVHHEMGHIQYFMIYRRQPALFRDGANSAFHEAVGDTIALSFVTPEHLKAIGLTDDSARTTPREEYEQSINFLMRMALQKVAFIPFAYAMDKWRMKVFRGEIPPEKYNSEWWKMSQEFQGIKPPVPRTEDDFDPGSKYHIPANVPYYRYFLSFIGQFQFHEALCKLTKKDVPLHKCDIYLSKLAGDKLRSVLSQGKSVPWPEQLNQFTGSSSFNVAALLKYFQPLSDYFRRQNKRETVGW